MHNTPSLTYFPHHNNLVTWVVPREGDLAKVTTRLHHWKI